MKEYIVPFTDDTDMDEFERIHGTSGMIIRCKDCKWHKPKYMGERPTCLIYLGDWHDYDYCSRAERQNLSN